MKVFLIANLAGGVGKTSITHSLATAMSEYGKNVLVIDADPAATLTFLCGLENPRYTSREFFDASQRVETIAIKTVDRFTLIPSASRLLHTSFSGLSGAREQFQSYDAVLIDAPAGPNTLISPLISISDEIIAPITGEFLSVRGLLNLRDFVAKSETKPKIRILENKVDSWDPEIREALEADFDFLEVPIRKDGELPKSQSRSRSVLSDSPHAEISADCRELAYLLLEEIGII